VLRGWLHALAAAVTVVAAPFVVARGHGPGPEAALAVYMTSIAALFGVSAAFHRISWSPPARRRMRRADHATIFVAIAGTYTAVAGLALAGWPMVLVLSLVWGGAAVGITVRQVWLDAPKWAVAVPYVVVGWCALAVLPQLLHALGGVGFTLLVAGGAAYTMGALVYARRRPDPVPGVFGYHEVFHLCTVIGATLHFVVVMAFVLP
jgi:hemolysin III